MRVFVAAPLFSNGEHAFNSKIAQALRSNGHNVWLAQEAPFKVGTAEEKKQIFGSDIDALKESDVVVGCGPRWYRGRIRSDLRIGVRALSGKTDNWIED